MRKNLILLLLLLITVINYQGCNRDEVVNPNLPAKTDIEGVYVLSEGGFASGTAKLSYYSIKRDTFFLNIFNPGNLGLFPDGLIIKDNYLFIAEQGSYGNAGTIYKTDTNGTVVISNQVGINPYSIAYSNDKLYITNGPAGNVSVLNKNTLAEIKTVQVGVFPQEILSYNNYVFVCNTSMFLGNKDSTVSVIDSRTDQEIKKLAVKRDPSALAITNDLKLLVGCNDSIGYIYVFDPVNLIKVDSFYNLPGGFGKDICVDKNSSDIYYIANNNNIMRLNLNTRTVSVFITNPNPSSVFYYGYAYDYKNKRHYVADARNFTVTGLLRIFDNTGNPIKVYDTGIAPRRIVLKLWEE